MKEQKLGCYRSKKRHGFIAMKWLGFKDKLYPNFWGSTQVRGIDISLGGLWLAWFWRIVGTRLMSVMNDEYRQGIPREVIWHILLLNCLKI
jgi:hypothetical protein